MASGPALRTHRGRVSNLARERGGLHDGQGMAIPAEVGAQGSLGSDVGTSMVEGFVEGKRQRKGQRQEGVQIDTPVDATTFARAELGLTDDVRKVAGVLMRYLELAPTPLGAYFRNRQAITLPGSPPSGVARQEVFPLPLAAVWNEGGWTDKATASGLFDVAAADWCKLIAFCMNFLYDSGFDKRRRPKATVHVLNSAQHNCICNIKWAIDRFLVGEPAKFNPIQALEKTRNLKLNYWGEQFRYDVL